MTERAGTPSVNAKPGADIPAIRSDRLASWLPFIAAAAGFFLFLAISRHHAHSQASVLDEGLYLYKGWLFVTGRYVPYQDFGPWTNHMPASSRSTEAPSARMAWAVLRT